MFVKRHPIFNPVYKFLIHGAGVLTVHATSQTVVPGEIQPMRKLPVPFIVKGNATFGVWQKSIRS
jgi:hypothetical protein